MDMAESAPSRQNSVFAVLTATAVAAYFAFALYAGWVILQYGVKTADFGWQIQHIGEELYVVSIEEKGPAIGALLIGDRIVSINGEAVTSEAALGLALKSIAGSGLYSMRVQRRGIEREVWLRSRTRAGFSFFRHRLPLLGSSAVIFFSGLSMLLLWNSSAARFGFLACAVAALRMGAWAVLPLSVYFQPREYFPLFLFCLPAGLVMPLAYQSLLHLAGDTPPPAAWRRWGWVLAAAWFCLFLVESPLGSVAAPVSEGLAYVYPDRVEYRQFSAALQYGTPAYLLLSLASCGLWIRRLLASNPSSDLRRRLHWILACGGFFATPAAVFEISEWLGVHSGVTGWNWLLAMFALSYQHVLTKERIASPATAIRGICGRLLPESVFRRLDAVYFPEEAAAEQRLRAVIAQLDACRQIDQLGVILTQGVEEAVGAPGLDWSGDSPSQEPLPLAPKQNGDPYTRRERRLIQRAVSHFFAAQERLRKAEEPRAAPPAGDALNLMRECPRCGCCYDSNIVRCPHDQEVPVLRLPIERAVDGKYTLERLIGRGGMGAVYAGRDKRLDRRVAIKVMLSELFGQQAALKRFEREAQLAARMNHPNIIQVHDFGPIGAMGAYLVMEYVEGRSWREELAAGPIPLPVCLPWIQQLLDGIEAAHANGIIHRDLKPENLLLEDHGHGRFQLKILDFGLAKMQLLNFSREEHLSIGVDTIGTVGYVPPEQLTGAPTDARSDIYAMGRIIVETLTGSLPEEGAPGLDDPLRAVIARCVASRKEERYASVGELRPDLMAALSATHGTVVSGS